MDKVLTLTSILAALSFQSLFMVIFLFTERAERRAHFRLLGCVFIMLGAWFVSGFLQQLGFYQRFPWAINWLTMFVPLFVPCLYFYVQALSARSPWRLGDRSLWHWGVALAIVLTELPLTLAPGVVKLHLLDAALYPASDSEQFLLGLGRLANMLLLAQSAVYVLLSLARLAKHDRRIRFFFSNIENRNLAWLRNYLLFMIFLWGFGASDFFNGTSGYDVALHAVYLCWLAAFSLMGLRQGLVYAPGEADDGAGRGEGEEDQARPARQQLPAERRARVAAKLRLLMEERHFYRDGDLTLRKLSDEIGVSTHHLSETLRDEIGQNFYDYVNGWRVNEACELLRSSDHPTIEIAFAVGFNSRSTFSAAFRKHAGTSPAKYRKSHANLS
jgi:AraC-like DNA-binding protein